MEAFGALIYGDLPPVGNRICWHEAAPEELPSFIGYQPLWLDCGTSALAVALLAAKAKRPEISAPEVVVPAYCCPDLVAAANFAGVKVVVVDIAKADPALDANALQASISDSTVAIIAVNFLGICDNLAALTQLRQQHPHISLIEDNAQWFPDAEAFSSLMGDYVVFSFGRGKPLSLLGGGLLLAKAEPQTNLAAYLTEQPAPSSRLKLKVSAYNLLLQPRLYQLLNRNPLLKLGETRYHSLTVVTPMDDQRRRLLPENFNRYSKRSQSREFAYDKQIPASVNCLDALTSPRRRRLLRYPLLVDDRLQRDLLLQKLRSAGLGATAMYQKPLPEIPGVEAMVDIRGNYNNARDFADRLITLPLHEGVDEKSFNRIINIILRLTR